MHTAYQVVSNNVFVSHAVLAVEPDVILMDEPTSALDPISTLKVEELVQELKENIQLSSLRTICNKQHVFLIRRPFS